MKAKSKCDKGGSHAFHTIRYCAICLEEAYDDGYEQGKSESLLLRDAEKKALAKKIQKKWKLAYCGNEMFYDFDEYMRQLVRDLGS